MDKKEKSTAAANAKESTSAIFVALLWRMIDCSLRQADMIKNVFDELGLKFKTHDEEQRFHLFQMISLEKLKHACDKEKLLEFLQCVFVSTGAAHKLGIGSFGWNLIMYLIPHGKGTQESEKLIITKKELKKLQELFVEELGPSNLFKTLMGMALLGEKYRLPYGERKMKMKFLLKRLLCLQGTDKWFRILQNYCRENGKTFVLNEINKILGKRAEGESQPGKEIFTAAFRLVIHKESVRRHHKKGYTSPMNDNQVPDLAVDISIQDSKWHLHPSDGEESSAHIDKDSQHDIAIFLQPDLDTAKEKTARRENQPQKRKASMCNDVVLRKRLRVSPSKHDLRSSKTRRRTRRGDDGHLLSSRGLSYVAHKLGFEWKNVMRCLSLEEEETERIQMDIPHSTLGQINKSLIVWSNQSKMSANEKVQQLLNAIKEAGRHDLFHHLKEKYSL